MFCGADVGAPPRAATSSYTPTLRNAARIFAVLSWADVKWASVACTFITVAKPIAVSESSAMVFGAYFFSTARYRSDCVVPASGASTGEE